MEHNFHYQENIEAYLSGKLNPEGTSAFENELSKDPLLKTELQLQKDIIESLKAKRVLQLKSRLNNIEVGAGSTGTGSLAVKIAASLLIPAILGTGAYFLLKDEEHIQVITPVKKEVTLSLPESETINETSAIVIAPQAPEAAASKEPQASNTIAGSKAKKTKKINKTVGPELKDFSESEFHGDINMNIPQGELAPKIDNVADLKVSVDPGSDKKFHYKFYGNKLFLYCDFQSRPYEILELNSFRKRKLYLYYNMAYYELKSKRKDITPLTELKDQQLIKQLSSIREK